MGLSGERRYFLACSILARHGLSVDGRGRDDARSLFNTADLDRQRSSGLLAGLVTRKERDSSAQPFRQARSAIFALVNAAFVLAEAKAEGCRKKLAKSSDNPMWQIPPISIERNRRNALKKQFDALGA